MVEFHQPLNTV
jgi:hypothetical protein